MSVIAQGIVSQTQNIAQSLGQNGRLKTQKWEALLSKAEEETSVLARRVCMSRLFPPPQSSRQANFVDPKSSL